MGCGGSKDYNDHSGHKEPIQKKGDGEKSNTQKFEQEKVQEKQAQPNRISNINEEKKIIKHDDTASQDQSFKKNEGMVQNSKIND